MAPFFVGDSRAPRFVEDGRFPWNPDRRATLADVRRIGDVVLLRYALSDRLRGLMNAARRRSPPRPIRTQVSIPLRFADGYATPRGCSPSTDSSTGRAPRAAAR